MKKCICVFLIALILVAMMVGCSTTTEVAKELYGSWGYLVNSIDGPCYQFYIFSSDGTYQSIWDNQNAPRWSRENKGTYKIKNSEIILTDEEGDVDAIIEYTFNDGELKMVDTLGDGSGNYPLIRAD